ncbi:MAG: glycosyltransferase family 39 protein [Thermoflexales bacterium]|nr:glycosyltransferase family 39 protein [Thermoflexales bacterium]MDW8351863.1 glycosyltransferase family 39 protein [Anaerolineae bacterium]
MKLFFHSSMWAALATLLGFALRLPLNDTIPPRWDEGWSVAHASLPIVEQLAITAADVHPPLYYLLLSAWQRATGHDLFAARYLSALLSATAIPLTYVTVCAWARARRAAVLAAFFMAWMPLAVYYGGVVRMYALAPSLVLLATYGACRELGISGSAGGAGSRHRSFTAWVIGMAGAMLTLYHAFWSLVAIAIDAIGRVAFARDRRAARRIALAIGLAACLFAPWGAFAVPQFLGRAAAEATTNIGQQFPVSYFVRQGVFDLTMAQRIGIAAPLVIGLIIVAGVAAAATRRRPLGLLALPLMMIGLTLLGVAFAARQWAFNARMLICATPAVAMLLGWAFDQLLAADAPGARRERRTAMRLVPPLLLGSALLAIYWPTSTSFVYAKTLEVFDPYNPHTYRAHIAPFARPDDLIFFNVLSPAGFYALDRQTGDADWSYALTWDPVIEPRERWESRIAQAAQQRDRLWIVLYRGLAGRNGDLRGWMDSNFYPAHAQWGEEEVFYGLYGVARGELRPADTADARWGDVALQAAHLPRSIAPGAIVPVALTWRAEAPVGRNYKVFVHAVRPADGSVIAQHDAQPLNDLRPMATWPPGEAVRDNHGLALPAEYRGPLHIIVGLYDPDTGERLRTNGDHADAVMLATVIVE